MTNAPKSPPPSTAASNPALARSRPARTVLLVDERIERLQAIERALLAMGLGVQSCARFEQAFYVADAASDVLLLSAEAAERAGWSQAETLRSGPTGRLAALCYGAPAQVDLYAESARAAGYEPLGLDWMDERRLAAELDQIVARAAPSIWVLSADERPGDRTWSSALERAGFRVSWMRDGTVEGGASARPFGIVLRDDAETVGSEWPLGDLRELARDARLVVLGRDPEHERRRAWRELGAAAYVEEPFRPEVLLAQLTAGTERRPPAAHGRDGALGALWVGLDRGGRVVEWNSAAAEFLAGPGASDVLPLGELNWFDLLCAPSAREMCREQLDALASGAREVATGEWPVSAHDGEVQWLHWTCRRTADSDDGQAAWVLFGVSDGLWRRWMRGDYGAAIAGADRCGDSLVLLDRQVGEVVFAGSRAQSWWGIDRDQLARSPRWWQCIATSDHTPLRSALERARRGQAVRCGFELERVGADARLVHARLFMLRPDERGPALVAVLLSEIGAGAGDKAPVLPLAVSIEALLTAAPIVPFSIDAQGHLTLAHGDLAAELGLIDEDGRCVEIDVRRELPALTERLQEAFDGRGFSVPLELGGRHVELSLWPRFDEHGEVALVGGVAVDTSDSRRVREALRLLVEVTSAVTGQQFFHKLVHGLVRALGVRLAYLAERVEEGSDRLRVLSCWAAGEFEEGEFVADGERPEATVLEGRVLRLARVEASQRCRGFPFAGEVAGWVGVPVRDAVGEVVGVLALSHDRPLDSAIVDDGLLGLLASRAGAELERLRADALLEKSRGRWRSLVKHVPDLVATIDEDGTVTFSNGHLRRGESIYDRCAPDHRVELERHVDAVVRTGESRSVEHRMLRQNEPDIWFHTRIGSYESEAGGAPEVVLISTDITERKAQEERAQFRGEMEKLVTAVSTRFINLDPEEVDQHLAAAVCQVGEQSGADRCYLYDLAGDGLVLRHRWRRSGALELPDRIARGDGAFGWLVPLAATGEDVHVRAGSLVGAGSSNEGAVWLGELERSGVRSLVGVPVTSGGEVRGFLGFDSARRDLDWDRAVVALLRLLGDVFANIQERQRVEREREVLSQQLRQVQKLEAIGTLAGGVAHDFNNLLMSIGGHAELIQRATSDADIRREAETIRRAAKQGSKLTRQLLNFARRGESRAVAVDLEEIVREVCMLLDRTLGKHIVVTTDFRSSGAYVLGDPGEMQQVVLNLAVNAGDAMESGGTLSFGTYVTEVRADEAHLFPGIEPGEYLRFFVSDTGCGMTDAEQARIFEPFFTTKPEGKGTGMGLALVYGIVRSVGGRIDVNSRKGEGTTFEILLPLATGGEALPEPEEPTEVCAGTGRVLVVDDEDLVRETACEMARALGYDVVPARGGEEALDLLRRDGPFDAMLVDLRMPVIDGVELLERMRRYDLRVPAVLCSGGGWEKYGQRLGELDLAGFLHKPFQLAELSSVLAQVTQPHGEIDAAPPPLPRGDRSGARPG